MDKFKKLDKITFEITNKIFKKYDYQFIKISENWKIGEIQWILTRVQISFKFFYRQNSEDIGKRFRIQ